MDLEKSESGKLVLVIGSVGEIISLFTLLVLNKSSNINNLQTLLNQSFKIAAFFILSYIVFKLIKLLIWWYPEIIENVIFKEDASSIELRLSFFVMFLMASLASLAGIEFILGAFMGGAIFSYFLREKESLEQKLSSIGYGFFIPIFFINTGLNIHIQSFNLEIISKTLLYAFLIFLLKFLASPILFFANRNLKFSLLTPLFLSFPFSILIAAIELTNNLHLINSQERLELYFSAILSSLIYPSVLKLFVKELN